MEDLQYQLIIQFLEGKLDDTEKSSLKQWRVASPENETRFQEVKFLWQKSKLTQTSAVNISIDVDAALKKVHRQLPPPTKIINLKRRRFIQISAAAAVVFLAGLFWMLNSSAIEMMEVKTLANEQKKVILPDESIVWLNENSQLTYPKSFEKNKREVTMNGDLVFEVTPNKQKPFIVKSRELVVQVLGTKFNVISPNLSTGKADNTNPNSFVHVLHGKVKVQRDDFSGNQLILEKGMSAVLDKKDALSLTDDFSSNRLFWLNKEIEFDRTSLKDVFADLENIFKVKLEIENPKILNCEFTGSFDDSNTVDEILEMMTAIFNLQIEKVNSTHFKIRKGTC